MQEIFLKLWLDRETLKQIEEPAAWLIRLSSNKSLNYLQRLATYTRVTSRLKMADHHDDGIEAAIDLKKIQEVINTAVELLPEKRREVYSLSRESGLTRREIASRLNVSESTIKNQLTAALRFIQEYLQKNYGIYIPGFLLLSVL